jgi:hypothetical protein
MALAATSGCDDFLTSSPNNLYTPDWAGVSELMLDHCVRCHRDGGVAFPKFPDAIAIDVWSGQGSYVVVGDPEASMLWRVVSNNLLEGDPEPMPLGGSLLTPAQTDAIRLWIEAGAIIDEVPVDADSDGFSAATGDCDDNDDAIHPGAEEVCDGIDNDCDFIVDQGLLVDGFADSDGDEFGDPSVPVRGCPGDVISNNMDCNDADRLIHPDAAEWCDGIDNNCDLDIDPADSLDADAWYADVDNDGYGDAESLRMSCEQPAGYVADDSDCNDGAPAVHPGRTEICDGADQDCDGDIDEGPPADAPTWYLDRDDDGFGESGTAFVACTPPAGFTSSFGDCNDSDDLFYPGASETSCTDPNDYNCDGVTGLVDSDGDGFGACEECDDNDPEVNPDASETCDGVDEDCNGLVDDEPSDSTSWFVDVDGDGFAGSTVRVACAQAADLYLLSTDCNDADPLVFPGAAERCNGDDDNCNGPADDGATDATIWHADADGDTYGDLAVTTTSCSQPSGFVLDSTDCDDGASDVNPGISVDLNDGRDEDCDGAIDEDATTSTSHAVDIQPIWDNNCTNGCHSGPRPAADMRLQGDAYPVLVNQLSGQASLDRVEPSDPVASYLWHKLNGTHLSVGGEGDQMPRSGQNLTSAELLLIEQWILEGAPP